MNQQKPKKDYKNITYPTGTPVTEETFRKLARHGIIDETLVLVQPKKNGWISEDKSAEVLKRWGLS